MWNVIYNEPFVLSVPREVRIVGFVNDPVEVVTAKQPDDIEVYVMKTIKVVKFWLERTGMTLADERTEAVGRRWTYGCLFASFQIPG